MRRRWIGLARQAVWLGPLLLAALLAGCDSEGTPDGEEAATPSPIPREMHVGLPRPFQLGLSSFPAELTEESYRKAFALAGQVGELVLIQRAPPWGEFVAGGTLSKNTQETTQEEMLLAEENNLAILFGIDPTDSADRGRLQDLPDKLTGKNFADEEIREAFIAYVKYVALNYEPQYLALGIEINMYYERQPDDFDNFVSLYFEAYDVVKSLSPDTLVFPTFQLEAMQNLLSADDGALPEWHLLRRFEPKLDLVVLSTYPSFVFDKVEDIPTDYFTKVSRYTNKPVAIASAGYSSGPGRDGLNEGTEEEQAAFVQRLLEEAENSNMAFVVWLTGCDLAFDTNPPFDLYNYIGLCRSDGSHKPAWLIWAEQAARPLRSQDFKAAGQ